VAGDFDLKGLGEAMDQGALVADIVSTWLEKGQNRQTVCFAVNRLHAKNIQKQFEEAGVMVEYMDAFTPMEERAEIIKRFENRDTQVICNVGVLTTGFDADVRCIILARPTKSEMLYVQMIGRGLRPAKGKDHCLILDHSDTTIRLGFVTDIAHTVLHNGTKNHQTAAKREPLPKECPKCTFLKPPKTAACPSCGFKAEAIDRTEVVDGELLELTKDKKYNKKDWHPNRKQTFYEELLLHAHLRGYKHGWAAHAYKQRLGVWPRGLIERKAPGITVETESWIRHYTILKAKQREKQNARTNTNEGTGKGSVGEHSTNFRYYP
jgi:superfamily II DNA or RNA helicase